jgi:hypothetical protein
MVKDTDLIYMIDYPKLYLSAEVLGFMQDFHNNESISYCDKESNQYQRSIGPLIKYVAEMSSNAFKQTRHLGRVNGALITIEMIDSKYYLNFKNFKKSDSRNE